MQHNAVRNSHLETREGETVEFKTIDGDEVVLRVPVVSVTETVSEHWCATCQQWFEVRGIMGYLMFVAEHTHKGTV